MAEINIPHARIPFVDTDGKLTSHAYRFLYALWMRTGGHDDALVDLQNGEVYESGITDSQLTELSTEFFGFQNEVDSLSNSKIQILENKIIELQSEIDSSPLWQTPTIDDFQLISTGAIYTTTRNQIIVVTSSVTITLNANPKDKETAIIKRATAAGTVTISAGAKKVDGAATYDMVTNYESAQCVYSYPDDEWFIV